MAAVISGGGLGLFDARLLQSSGSQVGQGGAGQYVNISTGNLVLQSFDEQLLHRGMTVAQTRTYNSLGTFGATGADGWVTGFERRVDLHSGTFNTSGSVVRRQTGDGTYQDFYYVAENVYVSTGGDGADDTLTFDQTNGTWTWREGTSLREEDYDAQSGILLRIREFKSDGTDPTVWTLTYSNGRIASVANASGEALVFGYNGAGQLTSISTLEGGVVLGQVFYGYDAVGRLTEVITDLTPDAILTDEAWDTSTPGANDGKRYRTTYTYVDGTSLQIASVAQSDGTVVSYTYDAQGRISSVTRGAGAAAEILTYTYGANTTSVTDALNRTWTYTFDAQGRIATMTSPPTSGLSDVTSYQYSGDDLVQMQVVRGSTVLSQVDYQYDARGNLLWQWDLLGNALSRTYDANNQLLTETRYTGVDPDRTGSALPTGDTTTRYVYDARARLRFVVDATGNVTEFRYGISGNATGQQIEQRQFASTYTGGITGSAFDEASLTTWAASNQTAGSLAVSSYTTAGRLASTTRFGAVKADGTGDENVANETTNYTYTAQGLLAQQIRVHSTGANELSSFVYDGMGRLQSTVQGDGTDAFTLNTTYSYADSGQQILVQMDGGATRTETRDSAGRLLSSAMTAASQTARITQFYYDTAGQLRAARDANGGLTYSFYDAKGRLEAVVDSTGAVTRTVFDDAGRMVSTMHYVNRVDTSTWLVSDEVVKPDFASIGVVANANDRSTIASYDAAGRLVLETDALGNRTRYTYDGAGQLLQVVRSDAFETALTARTTRYFYDAAGRAVATLDAEGYLTETTYDAFGRAIATVRYASASPAAQRATGNLASLRPEADPAHDQITRSYYDRAGHLVGTLDAEGYLTEWIFDEAGNARSEKRYAAMLTYQAGDTLTSLRSRAGTAFHQTRMQYNALGQLVTQTNFEGTATKFFYDEAGRLVLTRVAEGFSEMREDFVRYNAYGEVTGELHGEAAESARAALLPYVDGTTAWNETAVDNIYAQYGTRHSYDVLGRRIESVDAKGNKTWVVYNDVLGRKYIVRGMAQDANGNDGVLNGWVEISEIDTNSFGEIVETIDYTGRMTLSTPGSRASVQTIIDTLSYLAASNSRRQYAYEKRGLLASVTNAENVQTKYTYNAFGELALEQRAFGTSAQLDISTSYDKRGLAVGSTEGFGTLQRSRSQVLDAFGRVVSTTDARGSVISFGYDRLGRQLTTSQYVMGRTETHTTVYDAYDRVVTQYDAFNRPTTFAYDDTARTLTVTTPEGVVTITTHDRLGQAVSVDLGGVVTTFAYDDSGNLVTTGDELGNTATREYDVLGQLVATIDASGRRVEFRYDAAGRALSRIEDPAGLALATRYVYDAQGRQVKVTDASGRVTTFKYDGEGRLTEQALDPSGINQRTHFDYDALGRTVRVTSGYGSSRPAITAYTYDALGRRTSEAVDPDGLNLNTRYVFDANDNVVRRIDANGTATRYYYDQANQLIYIVEPLGALTRNWYDVEGRLAATRTFAQSPMSDLTDTTSIATLDSRINWSAPYQTEYRIYDKDGRLSYTMDGTLREVVYDGANRVIARRTYSGVAWTAGVLPASGALFAGTALPTDAHPELIANPALDEVTYNVYDAAGRVVATVDGMGGVTELFYDAAGRQVGSKRYATAKAIDATLRGKLEGGTAVLAEVRPVADATHDMVAYTVFDAAGRAQYQVDAAGAIRESVYDDAGRVIGTRAYAVAMNTASILSALQTGAASAATSIASFIAANTSDVNDTRSWYVYDGAGRLAMTVDAQDYVSQTSYDAAGRVVTERQYINKATLSPELRTKLQAGTATVAEIAAASPANANDRVQSRIYDAAGRVRYTLTLGIGSTYIVQGTRYDLLGHVIEQIQYGVAISSGTTLLLANVSNALTLAGGDEAVNQRTTRYVYDLEGRVRFTIDDAGIVTEQRYNGLDQVVLVRAYQSIIATNVPADETAVAAAVAGIAQYRDTSYTYTYAGQVQTITDALNHVETFTYDPIGRKRTYTDKLGYVWTYDYDAAGRLVQETSPAVSVTTWSGTAATSVSRAIVTQMTYDAQGNVVSRIEDAGYTNRTTQYEYDSRGHQVKTIFPAAGNVATNGTVSGGTDVTVTVTYDALGRAVVQKDANGNYQYKVYDTLGRLTFEVEQYGTSGTSTLNYATEYGYDSFGQQATITRYANSITLASTAVGKALSETQAQATTSTADRTITTTYDRLGRKSRVQQPSVATLGGTGTPTTKYEYDGYGNVVKESVLLSGTEANGSWAVTWNYYDQLGRRIRSIDAEGYMTAWQYNPDNSVAVQIEYARAINTAGLTTTILPTVPPAGDVSTGFDRSIVYGYDKMGRKTSETVLRHYEDSAGTDFVRNIVTQYQYDYEDRLVNTIIDGTSMNALAYDALGRTVNATEAARSVAVANYQNAILAGQSLAPGSTIYATASPYTTMQYDAFGNAIRIVRYANGKAENGVVTASAFDQETITAYDNQGRAVYTKDAAGTQYYTKYDAAGHAIETWHALQQGTTTVEVRTFNAYDGSGRLFNTYTMRGATTDGSSTVRYNAFGEIVKKGATSADVDAGTNCAIYEYDNAGRITRTNAETGAYRSYVYDLAGHQVREARSWFGNTTVVYDQQVDKLGRVVQQLLPASGTLTAQVASVSMRFDRWGNVLEHVDPRGFATTYQYNDRNQVVLQSAPLAQVLLETGEYATMNGSTWVRPVTEYRYDLLGNLVGTKDANGNVRQYTVNVAGQVTTTIDGTNATSRKAYDALGREVANQNGVGYVTFVEYDKLDRAVVQGDITNGTSGKVRTVLQSFVLDQDGNRVKVTDAMGVEMNYVYDSRQLLLHSGTETGVTHDYTYDRMGKTTRDLDALNNDNNWTYDYFGRVLTHNDLGNVATTFTYDTYSGLLTQTSAPGATTTYQYWANGQIKQVNQGSSVYEYQYDAAGNRIYDKSTTYDGSGQLVVITTETSFDSHNRVKRVTSEDNVGNRLLDLTYDYDWVGNRRRVIADSAYQGGGVTTYLPETNAAPVVVAAPANITLKAGIPTTWRIKAADVFRDPEATPMTYAVSGLPTWLTWQYIADTGEIEFTASGAQSGSATITLTATDSANAMVTGGLATSTAFSINVVANSGPAPISASALDLPAKFDAAFYQEFKVGDYFVDPDTGDTLSLDIILPANASWLTVDRSVPGVIRISGTPTSAQQGTFGLTLRATDGSGAIANKTINVIVATDRAPVAVADQTYNIPALTYFAFERDLTQLFSDADDAVLTYSASLVGGGAIPSWMHVTVDSGSPPMFRVWGTSPLYAPDVTIAITATDSNGIADTMLFELTFPKNSAPTVVGSNTIAVGARTNIPFSYSTAPTEMFTDAASDTLSYSLVRAPGVLPWLNLNLTEGGMLTLSGTPTDLSHVGDFSVTVRATDQEGASADVVFNFHVIGHNLPEYTPGSMANQSKGYNIAYTYTVPASAFADIDGDTLTYSAVQVVNGVEQALPSWLTFNATTRTFTGTPPTQQTVIIRVKAADGDSGIATGDFTLSIINSAPVFAADLPSAMSAAAGVAWSLNVGSYASDPNGASLQFSVSGQPTWMTINPTTGVLSGTPGPAGSWNVTVTATDGSLSTPRTITITTANVAPVIVPPATQQPTAGQPWSCPLNVSDANGDTITVTISGQPSWLTYNNTTRTFSGTPTGSGNWTVTINATDSNGGVATAKTFVVAVGNVGPTVQYPIADKTAEPAQAWSFAVPANTFYDANGDTLTYQPPTGVPGWMSYNSTTRTFSGTPTTAGSWTITLTVSDGVASVSDTFVVTVPNRAPTVLTPITDKTAQPSQAWSFAIPANTFQDPNSDALSYSVTGVPGWMTYTASTKTFSGTPTAPGSWTINVTASDGALTVTDSFVVTVPNAPVIVASPIPDQTAPANGSAWSYAVPANTFSDANATTLTVSASGTWPTWLTFNTSTKTFSGTPSTVGTWTINVTASDGVNSATDTFTITTSNVGPRLVTPVPDQSATQWVAWSYVIPANTFGDYNNQTLNYSVAGMPAWMSWNATTRTLSGTPSAYGPVTLTVTASDGSLSVSDTFVLNVATGVNHAPTVNQPLVDQLDGSGYVSYTFAANTFIDIDGDSLTYSASAYNGSTWPAGVSFDAATRTFSGTAIGGKYGKTYYIQVTASDGRGGTVSDSFEIWVEGYMSPVGGDSSYATASGGEDLSGSMGASMASMQEPDPADGDTGGTGGTGGTTTTTATTTTSTTASHQELWFTYDGENRVLINNGILQANQIVLFNDKQSYSNGYDDAGRAILRTTVDANNVTKLAETAYTERGQISTVNWQHAVGQDLGLHSEYTYDAAGRQLERRSHFALGTTRTWRDGNPNDPNTEWYTVDVSGWLSSGTRYEYDVDGRVSAVHEVGRGTGKWFANPAWAYSVPPADVENQSNNYDVMEATSDVLYEKVDHSSGYDASGKLTNYIFKHYHTSAASVTDVEYTNLYSYNYIARDGYLESSVGGENLDNNPAIKVGNTYSYYNAFGQRRVVQENLYDSAGGLHHTGRAFSYDGDGHIITRRDGDMDPTTLAFSNQRSREHYRYAAGQQVAHLNEDGKFDVTSQLTAFESEGTATMVVDGDTLRSISQRVYGTEDYWYVLADANALSGEDAELVVGTTLKAPELKTATNDASTFKPYDPAAIVGPTAVPAVHIFPPSEKSCDTLMTVFTIVAVIWVAAAVGTFAKDVAVLLEAGPVATGVAAGASAGAAAAATSGVIASSAGTGSFSWRNVLAGAVTGAITGGIAGRFGSVSEALSAPTPDYLKAAGLAFANAGAGYVGQKIAGVDVSFSWRSIAASATASFVSARVGNAVANSVDLSNPAISGIADGVIGAASSYATRRAFGFDEHWNSQQVLMDAFQNVISNMIAAASSDAPEPVSGSEQNNPSPGEGFNVPEFSAEGLGFGLEGNSVASGSITIDSNGDPESVTGTAVTPLPPEPLIGPAMPLPDVESDSPYVFLPGNNGFYLRSTDATTNQLSATDVRGANIDQWGKSIIDNWDDNAFMRVSAKAGISGIQGANSLYGMATDLQYGENLQNGIAYAAQNPGVVGHAIADGLGSWWDSPFGAKVEGASAFGMEMLASGGIGVITRLGTAERSLAAVVDVAEEASLLRKLANPDIFLDFVSKTWRGHQDAVMTKLASDFGDNFAKNVYLEVSIPGRKPFTIIPDGLEKVGDSFVIHDAKYSMIKDMTETDLARTFTKNQGPAFEAIANGKAVITLRNSAGGRALLGDQFKVGIKINVQPSINIYVNTPSGVVIRKWP